MGRGSWRGGPSRGFAGRGQWFNSNCGRGYQGYGRGFGNRLEDEEQNERYEDPTPHPGPNAKPRPGRGRGRGRGCYVCGMFGCHSRNHLDEQAAESILKSTLVCTEDQSRLECLPASDDQPEALGLH